jgi:hypothetical protein
MQLWYLVRVATDGKDHQDGQHNKPEHEPNTAPREVPAAQGAALFGHGPLDQPPRIGALLVYFEVRVLLTAPNAMHANRIAAITTPGHGLIMNLFHSSLRFISP